MDIVDSVQLINKEAFCFSARDLGVKDFPYTEVMRGEESKFFVIGVPPSCMTLKQLCRYGPNQWRDLLNADIKVIRRSKYTRQPSMVVTYFRGFFVYML